jgi:hypothetical protein
MAKRTHRSDRVVTGVASGSLGTGTALDDTQVYDVDALSVGEEVGTEDIAAQAAPAASNAAEHLSPDAPAGPIIPVPARVPGPRLGRGTTGGYPVGILAAAAIVLVFVAGLLTMRDGAVFGGEAGTKGVGGAASLPPPPSFGVFVTGAPQPTPVDRGHSHGHGHGH